MLYTATQKHARCRSADCRACSLRYLSAESRMSKQGLWRWFSASEGLEDLCGVFAPAQGQHGVAVAPPRVTQRVL
jgi:hypothetical protein